MLTHLEIRNQLFNIGKLKGGIKIKLFICCKGVGRLMKRLFAAINRESIVNEQIKPGDKKAHSGFAWPFSGSLSAAQIYKHW